MEINFNLYIAASTNIEGVGWEGGEEGGREGVGEYLNLQSY